MTPHKKVKGRGRLLSVSTDLTEMPGSHDTEFYHGWSPQSRPHRTDADESCRVAQAIKATASQCWFNARKVIERLDGYADASYVEGFAIHRSGLCIEHGWVVRGDTIIDPTLPEGVLVYFAGLEFRGRVGIAEFLATERGRKCCRSPFFHAFGWGGCESPSFTEARRLSHEFVYGKQPKGANHV